MSSLPEESSGPTDTENKTLIFLVKTCPDHGPMSTLIWKGPPDMSAWVRTKTPAGPVMCGTEIRQGCPFDCGICPQHRQRTCTALLEITWRCNLHCPVCFADSGGTVPDPAMHQIKIWYEQIKHQTDAGDAISSCPEENLRCAMICLTLSAWERRWAFPLSS